MRVVFLAVIVLSGAICTLGEKKIVCYFSNWAVYRPSNGEIGINHIDPKLCTHLIYAFAGITEDADIKVLDPWADLPNGGGKDGYGKFNQLRNLNPQLKTLIAVGGWNEGSAKYSRVASNPRTRKALAENAVNFVRRYGFNGLDLDWEYPTQNGGVSSDRQNFVLLLQELKQRFNQSGLILSAGVAGGVGIAQTAYNVPEVAKHVDFLNVMSYDFHGSWDLVTGINSPLYPNSLETGNERLLNVNASINYWLSQGAPSEKIIVGVPFYARIFSLNDITINGIKAPAGNPGLPGDYTRAYGTLGYNEVCEKQQNEKWDVTFQQEQKVPYAVKDSQWIGYDDPRSIKEKTEFIKRLNLGGAMAWAIDTDDFRGICGIKFPLLNALNDGLRK